MAGDGCLRLCAEMSTVELDGVRVAADYRVEFTVEGRSVGVLYTAPRLLEEAATGLSILKGLCGCGCKVSGTVSGGNGFLVFRGRIASAGSERLCPRPLERVGMHVLESIYRDFTARLPKSRCPYAVHRMAVYQVYPDGGYRFLFFVADPSRHAAAVKLAGMVSERLEGEGFDGIVAVSTGRISSDIVRVFSSVGISVIVSFHHPVLSGILEARKRGVTLVLRDVEGARFRVYTGSWRVS